MDFLSQVLVRDAMTADVATLGDAQTVAEVRAWLLGRGDATSHQGFPVVSADGRLLGVLTRRDLLSPDVAEPTPLRDLIRRTPVVAHGDNTLRDAADHMVRAKVGRLPVVDRESGALLGIISRSDLLAAHERRLHAAHVRGSGSGEAA
jgi:CBS domain-containing protein